MTIQFAQETTVCPITPLGATERRGLYYNKSDYIAFRKDCLMSVQMDQRKQGCSTVCLDGLENLLSRENAERRRQHITEARFDVLTEQEDQKLQGVSSPDFIAELYEDISIPCHQEAHEKALKYHEEMMQLSSEADNNERSKMMSSRKFGTKLIPNFVQAYQTTICGQSH